MTRPNWNLIRGRGRGEGEEKGRERAERSETSATRGSGLWRNATLFGNSMAQHHAWNQSVVLRHVDLDNVVRHGTPYLLSVPWCWATLLLVERGVAPRERFCTQRSATRFTIFDVCIALHHGPTKVRGPLNLSPFFLRVARLFPDLFIFQKINIPGMSQKICLLAI